VVTDPSRLLAHLAAHLGAAHVLTDPVDLAPHLTETRGLRRGHTHAVVRPADTEGVAFVVRACAEAGVDVVPGACQSACGDLQFVGDRTDLL
jgi:FAD/FMN-containing dehydrogenase